MKEESTVKIMVFFSVSHQSFVNKTVDQTYFVFNSFIGDTL